MFSSQFHLYITIIVRDLTHLTRDITQPHKPLRKVRTMGKINVKMSTSSEAAAAPAAKTPKAAANPVAETTPIINNPIGNPAPALFDNVIGQYIRPITLSENGKKYIDTLTEMLNGFNKSCDLHMTVYSIPDTTEVRVVVEKTTHAYIMLMFNESYTSQGLEPVMNMLPAFLKKATPYVEACGLAQSIVICTEDYDRVAKMAAHIANCFLALKYSSQANAEAFKNMKLIPDTDLRAVKEFIDRRSPHAVQDRIEWGVLLSREVRQDTAAGYGISDRPYSRSPIIAIGGYTRFLRESSLQGDKVYPICIITTIVSDVPCKNILAIALPVAARCAINDNQWRRPFNTIAKDKPNLGRLVRDTVKGELKFFNNVMEQNEEINRSFYYPQLALDIAEGRAHMVGLEVYEQTPMELNNMAAGFFGKVKIEGMKDAAGNDVCREWIQRPNTITNRFYNYEGSMIYEGKTVDTREIDYLTLVSQLKTTNLQIEQFLAQYPLPDTRLKNIAGILGSDTIYPTSRVHTIMFDSLFINDLSFLAQNVVKYTGEMMANTAMDIGAILRSQGQGAMIQGIFGNQTNIIEPQHFYRG